MKIVSAFKPERPWSPKALFLLCLEASQSGSDPPRSPDKLVPQIPIVVGKTSKLEGKTGQGESAPGRAAMQASIHQTTIIVVPGSSRA